MTRGGDGLNRRNRQQVSPAERRFLNGTTSVIPPGVLSDHEMWLATEATPEQLRDAWLLEELEDADVVRRGFVEEARWRLAEIVDRDAPRYRTPGPSERTLQRWIKIHVDEVEALMRRRRRGPQLSQSSAGARARMRFTPETGMYHHRCEICRDPDDPTRGKPFDSRRPDAKTCGPRCRKRLSTGATDPRRWQGDDFRVLPLPERQ